MNYLSTAQAAKKWKISERGYLRETCLAAQDAFKSCLDYFRIKY